MIIIFGNPCNTAQLIEMGIVLAYFDEWDGDH